MHSSRMHTGHSLAVFGGVYLVLVDVPGLGGVYLVPGGVHALGGCTCSWGDTWSWGWGVYLVLGGVPALGGCIPACTEADTPPVNRITDPCKNITLAQLRCGR